MVARPNKGLGSHEFFKVYYPDQSSTQLRLPPACVKHFIGSVPRNVKLVDLSGKSWQVAVEEAANSIFFKNGWKKFASDHSLGVGNFLVFKYTGNSVYDVTIFGTNGCVKEESLETSFVQKDVRIKEEPEEDRSCPNPPALNRGSQRTCVKLRLQRSGKAQARGSREVTRQKSQRSGPITSGQRQCGISDVQEFTKPTNPHFITPFKPGNTNQMNIPRKVLNEIKTELEPQMVICGKDGDRWVVGIHVSEDGKTVFSRGWAKVVRDNKLKLDDFCMFEFSFCEGKRLSNEVGLQIIRANGRQLPRNKA